MPVTCRKRTGTQHRACSTKKSHLHLKWSSSLGVLGDHREEGPQDAAGRRTGLAGEHGEGAEALEAGTPRHQAPEGEVGGLAEHRSGDL